MYVCTFGWFIYIHSVLYLLLTLFTWIKQHYCPGNIHFTAPRVSTLEHRIFQRPIIPLTKQELSHQSFWNALSSFKQNVDKSQSREARGFFFPQRCVEALPSSLAISICVCSIMGGVKSSWESVHCCAVPARTSRLVTVNKPNRWAPPITSSPLRQARLRPLSASASTSTTNRLIKDLMTKRYFFGEFLSSIRTQCGIPETFLLDNEIYVWFLSRVGLPPWGRIYPTCWWKSDQADRKRSRWQWIRNLADDNFDANFRVDITFFA